MKNVNNDLKEDNLKPIYLIYGNEDYILNNYKNKFIKHFGGIDSINVSVYNEENFNEIDIINKLSTNSLFFEKKLILFDDVNFFKKDMTNLKKYIEKTLDLNTIVIIEYITKDNKKSIDKRTSIYKFINETGYVLECPLQDDKSIIQFIKSKLKIENKNFENENVLLEFKENCSNDLYIISNELKKLIDYVGENEYITKKDIEEICSRNIEEQMFLMIDCMNNDRKKAMSLYCDMSLKNVPKELIFNLLKKNYLNMLLIKDCMKNNLSKKEMLDISTYNQEWQLNKCINQIRNIDKNILKNKINQISIYDEKIKTGNISIDMAMDIMIFGGKDENI